MKKLRKVLSLVMLALTMFGMTAITASAQDKTEMVVETPSDISIAKIDQSGLLKLSGGGNYSESFTMQGFLGIGTTHNAFTVKISDIVYGGCTVTITSNSGYYWSSGMIQSNTTITTTNASATDTYTVSITGHSLYGCDGRYAITSYIQ